MKRYITRTPEQIFAGMFTMAELQRCFDVYAKATGRPVQSATEITEWLTTTPSGKETCLRVFGRG